MLSVGLLVPMFVFTPVAVFAHETGEPHEEPGDGMMRTTAVEDSGTDRPEQIKKRVNDRKAAARTRVAAAKQARIKNLCQGSQGKLSSIHGRVKGLETSRTQVHQNLVNRLNKASEKLAAQSVDVTTLNEQIAELNTLIEAFQTSLAAYKDALTDVAEMDCAEDAAGFQLSLEAARQARSDTGASSQAIRTYLRDTIKPTLVELRRQLEQADGSTDSNETGTEDQSQGGESQ